MQPVTRLSNTPGIAVCIFTTALNCALTQNLPSPFPKGRRTAEGKGKGAAPGLGGKVGGGGQSNDPFL